MTKEKIRAALASVLGFRPVKTVKHKLLVISVHILLWGLFLVLPLFIYRIRIPDPSFYYREIINKSFLIGLFYLNFYYLLPRLFKSRKLFTYFLSLIAALAFLCMQQLVLEVYVLKTQAKRFPHFYRISPRPFIAKEYWGRGEGFGRRANMDGPLPANMPGNGEEMPPPPPPFLHGHNPRMPYLMTLKDALSSGIVILLLSGFIKLAHSLFISEKQKKILENERLNAELNFLKLQINPHFLFNTLNSIYSQAHFKSEQTEHSILKFSRIMRYVLYDSAADKIPLTQDLEYISNYIDLQQLRLSKNIAVNYMVTGPVAGLSIAPLLLITFIENAFKHGISYTTPSEIKIAIAVTGNELLLTVGNAITQKNRDATGGVGLINARRRLDVLYPGRHLLDVVENDHLYIVNLKIELDHES
ncbi:MULTISPECIES: sensor histidine kinase [Niastella]|uniref:Sensor histidine kinase n=1 Tax=Niastella soli TaxID=2821487 RepID=A0ABS3YV23_9BACT|nr:sensor histidine kinase [Niastella soli]MBO9201387.1 sensor histidine kinase [Niastella soli]